MLLLAGCLLFDDTPYLENLARLTDADGDGYSLAELDCNDADPDVNPGADEVCDGEDNNCDGRVDDVIPDTTWCLDLDGDGHGDAATAAQTCFPTTQQVTDCTDCDDANALVFPGQPEVCDGFDDNCDGVTDPDGAPGSEVWYSDADGDGYGSGVALGTTCEPIPGGVNDNSDCDDGFDDTHPGADEICGDGRDNNCDGDRNGCGWEGSTLVDTSIATFVAGPAAVGEEFGISVGVVDADGNGVPDVMAGGGGDMYGDSSNGAIHIWYGTPSGDRTVADASLHLVGVPEMYLRGPNSQEPPAWWGDYNEDGEDELVIPNGGYAEGHDNTGEIYALPPGTVGEYTPTLDDVVGVGQSPYEGFGDSVLRADALAGEAPSLFVTAPANNSLVTRGGAVYLVPGASPNAEASTGRILGATRYDYLGMAFSAGRDLDGDGTPDLAIGTAASDAPSVYIFRGPIEGEHLVTEADTIVDHEVEEYWGDPVLSIPDADGDGYDDLAATWYTEVEGADSPGRVYVLAGNASGVLDADDNAVAVLTTGPTYGFLGSALALGDIHADGVTDLVVGASYEPVPDELGGKGQGAVATIPLDGALRGEVSIWSLADAIFYGPDEGARFGGHLAVGDANRDGFDDLLVAATGWDYSDEYVGSGSIWFLLGGGI